MNKTEALLRNAREREAIRKLPADAEIFGWNETYDSKENGNVCAIMLSKPVDGPAYKHEIGSFTEMRLESGVPGVHYWWAP